MNAWHRVARLLIWTLTRLHAGALALTPRPRAARRHEAEVRAILQSDFSATCVRLFAYLGAVAILAVVSARIFHAGEAAVRSEPAAPPGWIDVARPFAAFALPMSELSGPYEYAAQRHAAGGRRDIMRWGDLEGPTPHLLVEIYRPGGEFDGFQPLPSEIAARTRGLVASAAIKPAGSMDTKFGPVPLAGFTVPGAPPRRCLGFARSFAHPQLAITGWYCGGADEAAARNVVACALDRLTLLAAGNEPAIGELFARADLKRNFCGQRSLLYAPTPKLGPAAALTSDVKLRPRIAAQ
ncbi:MAG TPA: hypothetical protein VFA53_09625 [Xanthobacteraceae bacterium]|nr:hypothetical protein [Xanthobacteraceae bacterium]